MRIGVDKAQKVGMHVLKHNMLIDMGHELRYMPLPYGDYVSVSDDLSQMIKDKIEKGKKVEKKDFVGLVPVSVDTKRDIEELYSCLVSDHERFSNECKRAQENNCHLYILTENEDGVDDLKHFSRWKNVSGYKRYSYMKHKAFMSGGRVPKKPVPASQLVKIMNTMQKKYGVTFLFCKPEETACVIERLLSEGERDGGQKDVS